MIEILSGGALNMVQDLGRPDHLGIGVSISGAMDAPALILANRLAGNAAAAAGIEISIFPFRVRFESAARFACTGATASMMISQRSTSSWWAAQAKAGDVLTFGTPELGSRGYLAISGGVDVPLVLGSRSTDLKSGFGGFSGRALRKGDRVALGAGASPAPPARRMGVMPPSRAAFAEELAGGVVKIRVTAAAEYAQFTDAARNSFERSEYRLTPDCNRQGYRLEGVALETTRALELLSHGIVPGTVQVPPAGQPIIQMAEANTCGGYPKIATVIEPDLWRLAQMRAGQRLAFEVIEHQTAVRAMREHAAEMARLQHALELCSR